MYSEIIKKVRLENHETQQRMADKLGVSQRTVASWESGDRMPTYEMLLHISDMYKVSTDYLLGRTKNPDFYRHNIILPSGQRITILSTEKEPPTREQQEQLQEAIQSALHADRDETNDFPVDPDQLRAFDTYIRRVVRAELDERGEDQQ